MSAAAIFVYQSSESEKAAAKKSRDVSNYEYVICPGENVQLDSFEGDYYKWTPAEGLNNSALKNPIASPKKTTAYTATVFTRLDTVVRLKGPFLSRNGLVVTKDFRASAYDSYDVSLNARSKSAHEKLQLQVRINDIPILRTTIDNDLSLGSTAMWDNIDENEAIVSLHVLTPENYNDTVFIDGLYLILLQKEIKLTQVFVDKTCRISASR